MHISIIRHQCRFLFRQRMARFTFYLLLILVLVNFTKNVLEFQGLDLLNMYHPTKLLLLSESLASYSSDRFTFFFSLYPILVVCPAGFLLISEMHRKEDMLLIARVGAGTYFSSSLISAFLTTAFIFSVPMLLELLLNCVSFPLQAGGDFIQLSRHDPEYIKMVHSYLFHSIYQWNPYFYAVFSILIFGIASGILGMLTVALTMMIHFPYKIFIFLPVFLLWNMSFYPSSLLKLPFLTGWNHYISLFNEYPKSSAYFVCILLMLIVGSVFFARHRIKGDQL